MRCSSVVRLAAALFVVSGLLQAGAAAQGLPAPRLTLITPMGGQAGTTVEVTLGGTDLDEAGELVFSAPGLKAEPKKDKDGKVVPNQFAVEIAPDAPHGIHEVWARTRFGVSTARSFVVGGLTEAVRAKANTTAATAWELKLNSVCNAAVTAAAVDHYTFEGVKGKRVLVDVAAAEIDSKLLKVIILADAQGRDLVVNRRGGVVDFTPPADGRYFIKVHSLTYEGGPEHFYRLTLSDGPRLEYVFPPQAAGVALQAHGRLLGGTPDPRMVADGAALEARPFKLEGALNETARLRTTAGSQLLPLAAAGVPAFSWSWKDDRAMPRFVTLLNGGDDVTLEKEPNRGGAESQKITLPCDLAGQFYPAADVDSYEFTAKKGEVWWIEVTSHRLGLRTDPFVVVQKVTQAADGKETLADVVELNDIANPVPGTPFDTGSADALGRLEIKEDGTYRMQVRDLFGGTKVDARNVYRLQVRKPQPGFALVAWPYFAPLATNDRSVPAKPLTLWKGGSLALQVAAIRRDGFNGAIELASESLPAGLSAAGSRVAAGKAQGFVFLTAAENAAGALGELKLVGKAEVDGKTVVVPVSLATTIWNVTDTVNEAPRTRLSSRPLAAVSGAETYPLGISAAEDKVYEAEAGAKLTIPLKISWRGEPTTPVTLKTLGAGFETVKEVSVPAKTATASLLVDLAALKTEPGEYVVALSGVSKGKFRRTSDKVTESEAALRQAEQVAAAAEAESKKLAEAAKIAAPEVKAAADQAAKAAAEKLKAATTAKTAAAKLLADVKAKVPAKDYTDLTVSAPVRILVKAKAKKP